jgi:hypothetical protein
MPVGPRIVAGEASLTAGDHSSTIPVQYHTGFGRTMDPGPPLYRQDDRSFEIVRDLSAWRWIAMFSRFPGANGGSDPFRSCFAPFFLIQRNVDAQLCYRTPKQTSKPMTSHREFFRRPVNRELQ